MDKQTVQKALAYVVHDGKLLAFRHVDYSYEEVGLQAPGGTIEQGETPEVAVLRELKEETGYDCFDIVKKLGVTTYDITPHRYEIQERHIFLVQPTAPLPERWMSYETHDDGRPPTTFENFWLPIAKGQILQSGQGALVWTLADQ
jgi:8-oxo-dGTP pyrophosphatase MutT (NUDIX family)